MSDREFGEQPWVGGMLELSGGALYLGTNGKASKPEPLVLYRPAIRACFSDTISFLGFERNGEALHLQGWYCETRGATEGK
ncbi:MULTISPECIES: hypothetical protein [unclassified Variovorax]|uniref:hypothetical protein n=1 Tax=unclassified Variovorax TaxID=663243 RepID=UPI0011AFA0B6|nr:MULTISPECIES: hypothetical protein [unclassified Variovorax]